MAMASTKDCKYTFKTDWFIISNKQWLLISLPVWPKLPVSHHFHAMLHMKNNCKAHWYEQMSLSILGGEQSRTLFPPPRIYSGHTCHLHASSQSSVIYRSDTVTLYDFIEPSRFWPYCIRQTNFHYLQQSPEYFRFLKSLWGSSKRVLNEGMLDQSFLILCAINIMHCHFDPGHVHEELKRAELLSSMAVQAEIWGLSL